MFDKYVKCILISHKLKLKGGIMHPYKQVMGKAMTTKTMTVNQTK